MKTVLQVDIDYNQLLDLVKQLPRQQKLLLSKELEREAIDSKLSSLLADFKTDELSDEILNEEIEVVRQEIYEKQKH